MAVRLALVSPADLTHRLEMADNSPSLASLAGKRYLVTGGTGFLGWHLIPVVRLQRSIFLVACVRTASQSLLEC